MREQGEFRQAQTGGAVETALPQEEWYDLLPVEKKLMGYSLALGIGLLIVFIFAFGVFK
ncbi:MAG: hypothetical protein AB1733_19150 [Thermodesulfobacteriota bacterium]